jgi:hypothetical protein
VKEFIYWMTKKYFRHEAAKQVAALLQYESYIATLALLGLLINTLDSNYGSYLITVALSTLAVLYLFKAYISPDDKKATAWEHFIAKLTMLSSSVVVIGIIFLLFRWPGDIPLLLTGGSALFLALPFQVHYVTSRPDTKVIEGSMILRTVLLLSTVIILFFWSSGIIGK